MSYIKVLLGGKERGLKFDQLAWTTFLRKIDHTEWASTANYAMVYAGLFSNCWRKDEEIDFTKSDVMDWVDALEPDALNQIAEKFRETQQWKENLEGAVKDTEISKKKPRNTVKRV